MTQHCPKNLRTPRRAYVASSAILLALASLQSCAAETEVKSANLVAVAEGPLRISVTETGQIEAANQVRVQCEMEGKSTVIWLIPEGSIVEKGTKLVELDASAQVDRKASQEIAVEKSNAAVVNAEENLDILKKQVASENRAADTAVEFAMMDKKKFYGDEVNGVKEMGEREQAIKAEEAKIALAESTLKLASDRFNWSKKLIKDGFITRDDFDKDRLDFRSKETELELARNKLDILKKYTHKKTERELDQALLDAKLERDRIRASGKAKIMQAEADLDSKKAENKLAKDQLKNLEHQIKSSIVYAPAPGIVVYGSEGDHRRRTYVEVGSSVRERQTLIYLPDVSHMQAQLSIQEARIEEIVKGQKAIITVDTLPHPLDGQVIRRAPLPDSGSRWGNPDLKVYKTRVDIFSDNKDRRIRPNMSCTVEIIVDELENVTYIPRAATFHQEAVPYVWLKGDKGPQAQRIELGQRNNTHVVVTKGLTAGQQIYLVPPPGTEEPKFKQPKKAEAPKQSAEDRKRFEQRAKGGAAGKDSGAANASGGKFNIRTAYADFKKLVEGKNPELAAKMTGMGWSRKEEITSQFDSDPELKSAWTKLREETRKAMSRFQRNGGGERSGQRSGRGSRGGRGGRSRGSRSGN